MRVGTLTLILADDVTLCRLNREFKGASGPTDVLSFDLADPIHPDGGDFGEIYISVDRAEAQARERSRGLSDEISWLAVHGTLHLLGYRHDEPGNQCVHATQGTRVYGAASSRHTDERSVNPFWTTPNGWQHLPRVDPWSSPR